MLSARTDELTCIHLSSHKRLALFLPAGNGWTKQSSFSTRPKMNQDTLRKWMREIETRRGSAGPPRPGPGGFLAGGGLVLLVAGGLLLNSSLFTGTSTTWLTFPKNLAFQ